MKSRLGDFFVPYAAAARHMLIDGVHIIFIAPPLLLLLLAFVVGASNVSHGTKAAVTSAVRVLAYGSVALVILFIMWVVIYYAGGGH
jgi:hypothetical protein